MVSKSSSKANNATQAQRTQGLSTVAGPGSGSTAPRFGGPPAPEAVASATSTTRAGGKATGVGLPTSTKGTVLGVTHGTIQPTGSVGVRNPSMVRGMSSSGISGLLAGKGEAGRGNGVKEDGENVVVVVYEVKLEDDGSPSSERNVGALLRARLTLDSALTPLPLEQYIRLPPSNEEKPYIFRITLDAGCTASREGVLWTNLPRDGNAFGRDQFTGTR